MHGTPNHRRGPAATTDIRFVVPGPPVPKARARVAGGHGFTPARTRRYEAMIRAYAMREVARDRWARAGAFAVTLRFFWPDARRRDLDNATKSVTDAMNRVAYDDDSQIRELHVYGEIDRACPRVEVTIERRPAALERKQDGAR